MYLDVGATNGDTVREFVKTVGGKYRKILAVEPEKQNFAELQKYVHESGLHDIELFNNGCSDKNGVLTFSSGLDGEGFIVNPKGTTQIEVKRIDQQFASEGITLIKINLEIGVLETLRGAEKVFQDSNYPKLAMTVGLSERGIIDIPQVIKEINPNIKLSMRYSYPMPARLLMFGY